ncbi:MAG: HAMP domain-containing histidine kinase, partial [Cyclobacteriaceae bacterium]|nr:HAMP domain-containing histidine kinase [Cyclobacteriaceae bacterium]
FVKLIDARLKTSSDVMNQLLKWAVTQLEGMHVKKQWLDLEDLIEENVNFFSEPIKEKNLVISTDIRHSAAYADREMISTTIRNLLSNSIKFSHSGKTIYIATSAKQETVYLSIRDEGVGMNLTWYNSLAENGILTTKSGTQGEQGTGFGLVITRDFVRMNGGELECESEEGVGTKFTIVLPLKK